MTLNPFGTAIHQGPATLMAAATAAPPPSSVQEDARLSRATARPIISSPRRPPDEGPAFLCFWWNEATRGAFLSHLPLEDLASLRRVSPDFSECAAPYLFADVTVTFRASTFSKRARMTKDITQVERLRFGLDSLQYGFYIADPENPDPRSDVSLWLPRPHPGFVRRRECEHALTDHVHAIHRALNAIRAARGRGGK
ncbi:MAG: hypothetical protein M1826_004313 [Phylliscum demangeonii]|nr:MAG: hypothetical protein M1826_004313 [Phylliscum demangeonii]